jgi:putative tryptophan/tyrosine transport system substrate-binding protein
VAPDRSRHTRRHLLQGSLALAGIGVLSGCGLPPPGWQRPKVARVGVLSESAADPQEARFGQAFRLGLRERGWLEGENLLLEYRWAEGDPARLPSQVAELVALAADLLVARSSIFTQAARQATSTIPIVFVAHADPVGTGHVESLARPGGNATGQAVLQTELGPKWLQFLTTVGLATGRIAALSHPDTPSHAPVLRAMEGAARSLGVRLQTVGARTAANFEAAFAAMADEGAEGLVVLATPLFYNERRRWAELALRHRLPSIYLNREAPEAGALMSYGPNLEALWRSAPAFVDKILKGAMPAELPVEQATTFDFALNLGTARALGLTIPPSVLAQATEVFQ